jgi:Baseplate J-like protein
VTIELYCPENRRRDLVRESTLNGIDFLEVLASHRTLLVHFLRPIGTLDERNVVIEGGVRVSGIEVEWAARADAVQGRLNEAEQARVDQLSDATSAFVVRASSSGDRSTYVLRLVRTTANPAESAPGFDELLSSVGFSFKVDCPSEFDCATDNRCEEPEVPAPHIDYLAKDYASFRRLMLDRLSVLVPDWRERSAADALMTLVELLAYSADSLSYFQDAAATEAYLGTARLRASVRRHARLVDYQMHDGASARVWVALAVSEGRGDIELPRGTMVLTGELGAAARLTAADVGEALSQGALVFETLHALALYERRNAIPLYAWGDASCCLPTGATRASLVGELADLALRAGDVLILEEVRDPDSGNLEDADPTRRHAVRLAADPVARRDTAPDEPVDVVEIRWHDADALPVALRPQTRRGEVACVAHGNVVLADHGGTILEGNGGIQREELGAARAGRLFRPPLARRGVTQSQPYDDRVARRQAAAAAARVDPRRAIPVVALFADGERWEPVRELLNSDRFAADFVLEIEEDGSARVRFGDGVLGRAPAPDSEFTATYRVGTGRAGNVGAGALSRIVTDLPVTHLTNPLPATGGADPEPIERVRLYAPQAFRTQKRAVTVADYAAFAERHPQVQKAGATRRWTGSWHTVFITVDRVGGRPIDDAFEDELRAFLDPFRLAGHDIEIDAPQFVSLQLELSVCVAPGYMRSTVKEALLEAFSSRTLRGGRRGFFHPDNFTFGQPVYVSGIVNAAMNVPGVEWVDVTAFHRYGEPDQSGLEDRELRLGRLEIARLDNDPSRPENGRIEIEMKGGL